MKNSLRDLAQEYLEIANSPQNIYGIGLHRKVNDRRMERPIVLIDEIPWHEMNHMEELRCQSTDPDLLNFETELRRTLFKWKYFPADMVVRPYIAVNKVVRTTGIGMEPRFSEHDAKGAKSRTYQDQIQSLQDLEKIRYEVISLDEKATYDTLEKVRDAVGEVPIKLCGEPTGYSMGMKPWDDISTLRGMDSILYDLVDQPELTHAIVKRLTDIFVDKVRQYNELRLFDTDAYYCHCASALTSELAENPDEPQSKAVWGRGLAQILSTVSPLMHQEFDTSYMVDALAMFGLVYYGCCEPLHHKIDVLKKIKNLRKISITPWADCHTAAEIMGKEYVMSAKAQPAFLLNAKTQTQEIESELSNILKACSNNNTSCEIVLKDITSIGNRLENLIAWEQEAMKLVKR